MGLPERNTTDALPQRISVRDCGGCGDGGTVVLCGTDEVGREVSLLLATPLPNSSRHAGRLYFDGDLVPMRSHREQGILRLLTEASIEADSHAAESLRMTLRQIVESVQSENYLRYMTQEERELAKSFAAEAVSDEWHPRSAKKKRREWRD